MKTIDIVKRLKSEGWIFVRQKGSHQQYKHPIIPELITLPFHGNTKDVSIGVLSDIKKKAGWK